MERVRLSDRIAEQLEQMIAEGALKPGERLPAERPLSERLGVSRPSLREAIQKLVSKGLIHTRQGGGSYVTERLDARFTDPLINLLRGREDAEFDALQVRMELEGAAAALAAERATIDERERMWFAYHDMCRVHRTGAHCSEKRRVDIEFHSSFIEASHNVVLIHFCRGVMEVLEPIVEHYLEQYYTQHDFVELVCAQHRAIVQAIADRDPDAARAAVKDHLEFAYKSFQNFQQTARFSRSEELRSRLFG
ncbi:MAG: FadR/GntR family transcriptional regulator [Gammaproteobacteria bacterium]